MKNDNVPNLNSLNNTYNNSRIIFNLLMVLSLFVCLVLLIFIYTNTDELIKILGSLGIIVSILIYFYDYHYLFGIKKVKLKQITKEKIGKLTVKDVTEITNELLIHKSRKEQPTVYIIEEYSSAFVTDISVFNFIKPLNAIYIPKYLFKILNRNELKSIIAHELGHFYKYMFPLQRFPIPLYLIMGMLPILLVPYIDSGVLVFIYFLLFILLRFVLSKSFSYKSKTLEYLSDLYASKLTSKTDTINAFLILGKYDEIIEFVNIELLKEIKQRKDYSIKDFESIYKMIMARIEDIDINNKPDIINMINEAFQSVTIKRLKKKLTKSGTKKENELIDNILENQKAEKRELIDWNEFDNIIKNNKIDPGEYESLINSIETNSDKFLFDSIIDEDNIKFNPLHPSIKKRILNIHRNTSDYNL